MKTNRRWIGYGLLLAAVWAVSYFIYPETLGAIERDHLFLWTPDYRASLWRQGIGGVCQGLVAFGAQFFRWREIGALLLTLCSGAVLLSLDGLLRRLFGQAAWTAYVVGGSLGCGLIGWAVSPSAHHHELQIRIEQAATRQSWNEILQLGVEPSVRQDPLLQKYLFLALAERQQLLPNLHRWSHLTVDSFYYSRPKTRDERYFNALFYRSLGIYNEYVHQLFEAGMLLPQGTSNGTLRLLAEGYLKMGDAHLAAKYLSILENIMNMYTSFLKPECCCRRALRMVRCACWQRAI